MTVLDVTMDPDRLTMTVTKLLAAPVERAWQLWADPRKLERWWGPPAYPATVVEHDLRPGGRITYFMTGPEGDRHHGWWRVGEVEAPHRLAFEDGFADEQGTPSIDMPTTSTAVALEAHGDGTLITITARFPDRDAMDRLLAMGMEQGLREALSQMDALVAA